MASELTSKRRLDWLPIAMILLSFLLALAVAFKHRGDSLAGLVDEVEYNRLAVRLLAGRGYDSTYWLPGFPAFVALVYTIAGERLVAVFAAHAVLWAVCLTLMYRIALLVTESRRVSILALALCVLWWPFYTGMVPRMLTEMLASVLIALPVYAMLSARHCPRLTLGIATGVLFGLAALTKSVAAALIPPAALVVFLAGERTRRRATCAVLILVGSCIVIVPWTVRNYNVTGTLVPISTGGGSNLWFGNHPEIYSRRVLDTRDLMRPLEDRLQGKSAVERDRILVKVALGRIRENPARAASILVQKFSKLWLGKLGLNPRAQRDAIPAVGGFGIPRGSLSRLVLMALAIAGWFALSLEGRKRAIPLVVLLIVWTIVYVALTTEPRYALPVQFYEMVFAAAAIRFGLDAICRRLGHSAKPSPAG